MPQQSEVAQGLPGRLRPRIFLTFGTTRVVGRRPYASAAFTPEEIPGTHFQSLNQPQGTWFCRWEPRKKSPVTPPGIDTGTVRPVAQRLNHYATPDPYDRFYSCINPVCGNIWFFWGAQLRIIVRCVSLHGHLMVFQLFKYHFLPFINEEINL